MIKARIINRGRGPEIEGTRITVYDVLEYYDDGWHRDIIACLLSSARNRLRSRPVTSKTIERK